MRAAEITIYSLVFKGEVRLLKRESRPHWPRDSHQVGLHWNEVSVTVCKPILLCTPFNTSVKAIENVWSYQWIIISSHFQGTDTAVQGRGNSKAEDCHQLKTKVFS